MANVTYPLDCASSQNLVGKFHFARFEAMPVLKIWRIFAETKDGETMISANIQSMIPKMQQYFVGQPIKRAWLFGSSSRGEEQSDSDIDILVQYDDNAGISLFTISRIMVQMRELLGRDVDLVEDGRLLPFAAASANRDKILIYERKS